jgi:hypothetical protein
VKFIAPLKGSRKKHYQFTAIDDCTRIRVLRIYDRLDQTTASRFLDYVVEKLPFKVEVIQTDNGAEFGSQFRYHVLDQGWVTSTSSRPHRGRMARSSDLTGSTMRSSTGCSKVVIDDTGLFNERLKEWRGLLQLQPAPWNSRRPDALREAPAEDDEPGVNEHRKLHTALVETSGLEPPTPCLQSRCSTN